MSCCRIIILFGNQKQSLGLSLLRNRGLAAKDILLDLARRCFWQLGRNNTGQTNDEAPAFAKATAWQANDEHARAGAGRVGGNAARIAGTSPGEVSDQCSCPGISCEQSVELEFGFGLLPGNQRFASVFGDCCFEIAEVFEIFDTLLKASHGLIECLDLFENGGVTHKLPFDLLQHKLESCLPPERTEHETCRYEADSDCLCL